MSRSPEYFRGMSPDGIMRTLIADQVADRHTQARAKGAACSRCMDTGMEGGRFCGCAAGAKVAFQSMKDPRP